jgi:hypothetical protein
MKRIVCLAIVLACGFRASPGFAGQISASGTFTATPDGADFDYTIKLTNTSGAGNDNIETFWFGWVPGHDFMAGAKPFNIMAPTGWNDLVTGAGNATDGFAIQFTTSTNALAPGATLDFKFTSDQSPAAIAGLSMFGSNPPVGTSFVYAGAPFQSDSFTFVVTPQAVPEPSSLLLGAFGMIATFGYMRIRRKQRA